MSTGALAQRLALICAVLLVLQPGLPTAAQQEQPALVPAGAAVDAGSPAWTAYQQAQAGVQYESGSVPASVTAHKFRTPLDRILAADVYAGSNARLRRVVADLASGRPVRIAAIGGVATNGSDATQPGVNDYVAQYAAYLKEVRPCGPCCPKPMCACVCVCPPPNRRAARPSPSAAVSGLPHRLHNHRP